MTNRDTLYWLFVGRVVVFQMSVQKGFQVIHLVNQDHQGFDPVGVWVYLSGRLVNVKPLLA
jgi:hypothetical protein